MNAHQTSICKGIPEEKLITWANRKNISQILIERFASKIVFRDRSCSYVMLETDQADICRSCAMLLSTSSMDMMEEQAIRTGPQNLQPQTIPLVHDTSLKVTVQRST